jgi:Protein of unknown function (DUF4240)
MTKDMFWNLIDSSRAATTDPDRQIDRLRKLLQPLDTTELLDFERELRLRLAESYRWDLWAVAYIVNGGCSDDGFDYFRGWLICQGRQYFEEALRNPESAANHAEPDANECEDMLYVAASIYKQRTGEYPPRSVTMPEDGPAGTRWKADQLKTLYPTLYERFLEPPPSPSHSDD